MTLSLKNIFHSLFKLLLLLAVIFTLVPFSPRMPATDIDYSWAIALNQALAQGLVFGRDIIFTLGPYASVYTKVYHPFTDSMMLFGSLYFAICYGWLCVLLMKRTTHPILTSLLFILALLGMVYARDVLFLSYPLLLGMWLYTNPSQSPEEKNTLILYALLWAPLGLIALIKGTFFIQIMVFMLISMAYFFSTNRKKAAIVSVSSTGLSCVFFWLAAHQPLYALPEFIIHSFQLSMGFSEAMSSEGNIKEVYLFLAISLIQLSYVVLNKHHPQKERVLLITVLFIYLFIAFKAGFTRHVGHAYVAGTALLFSGLIISLTYRLMPKIALIAISLLGCVYINGQHTTISLTHNIRATLTSAFHGIYNRYQDRTWPSDNYQTLMTYIATQVGLPRLKESSDIYSYHQVALIASGNHWAPRPIFQSYSVFTDTLAKLNQQSLQRNPPDYLFFRVQPIDNKFPAMEDGPSWRTIMENYRPVDQIHDYLILKRKPHQDTHKTPLTAAKSETHWLGETVRLPSKPSRLYANIVVKSGILGRLWSLFYHPSQLAIHLTLNDGSQRTFRLSANMAKAEFLLSPLVESSADFGLLFFDSSLSKAKGVQSIKVISIPAHSRHWYQTYKLYLN
jgi:hypothetical protein